MPQHGFLRNNYWAEVPGSKSDDDESASVSMSLELKDVVNSRGGKWDVGTTLDAKCVFTVKVSESGFTSTIVMENTGTEEWDFQVLLHTYFAVNAGAALDGETCNVKGLKGYGVLDKVTGEEYTLADELVTIPGSLVDRVHTPPEGTLDLDVTIAAGPDKKLSLTGTGDVDGTKVPISGVVWNPNKEGAKALGDFGDEQYVDMICVEPGMLSGNVLKGGKSATFTQVVKVL